MAGARRKTLEPWVFDSVEYYQHQADGVRKLMQMKSALLADDMGLGKSLQAMTVFAVDVKQGFSETLLVVCPTTLKENWAEELTKFTTFPFTILDGTRVKRLKQIATFMGQAGPRVMVVNYEQVPGHLEELNALNFDMTIFDEAHYIKNYKSMRTKACIALRSKRNLLLTGTPMLNHVNELWPILHKISPSTFPKYWSFVNRYCVFGGFQNHQIVGVKNQKELVEFLQGFMLRRLKSEVLDLPEVQYIQRRVTLSPEQEKLYIAAVDEMKLPKVGEAKPLEIENALTKFLRLKQICGTTLPFTGEDHSNKLSLAIEDDLELLEVGEKIVVFTQFREVQAAYIDRMTNGANAKISHESSTGQKGSWPVWQLHGDVPINTRQGVVNQWAAHKGPGVLICMLQVAGVGLNMTAAKHGSFLDKLFVPGLNQQAVDRMHRIGASETQPVQIREYITAKTIENRVEAINKTKKKLANEIVETDPEWKAKLYKLLMEEEETV